MYALDPVYPEVVRGPCLSLHRKEELAMDGGNQIFFFFFFWESDSCHSCVVWACLELGPKAVYSELVLGETLTATGGI